MFARLSPYGQAVIMALCGYIFFSLADVSAKILSQHYPMPLCIFLPAFIAWVCIAARILHQKGLNGFSTPHLKVHLLRSVVITMLVVLCVNALKLIPIADFYCIIFLSPFVVMALSILLFKEPLHWERILVLLISFVGVVIAVGSHFHDMNIGYAFVGCAVLFSATNVFLVRRIGRHEYIPLYGFYPLSVITLSSFPFALPFLPSIPSIEVTDLLLFLFYGVVLTGAHSLLPSAFARTPLVSRLTPLHYSQMVWGILAGVFVFDRPLEWNTLLGASLIICSGLGLFFYDLLKARRETKSG